MSKHNEYTRRRFLTQTAATGVAVPTVISRSAISAPDKPGAHDRIQLGLIGPRIRVNKSSPGKPSRYRM